MGQTSLIFTGDIGFDNYLSGKFRDENLLSDDVLSFLHSANHVIANVEGALCRLEQKPNDRFFHKMDPDAISVFQKMHADVYTIANNHSMDAGEEGLRQELEIAKAIGVKTVGAGMNLEEASKPVFFPEAGGIGIISVGYQPACKPASKRDAGNFSWDEFDLIKQRIQEIKKACRWAILIVHGGEEFSSLPLPYVKRYFEFYMDFGADIIVGHHPHVPQNYEILPDGRAIFYSLGNFIFDTHYQRIQLNTDRGVLLKLILNEDSASFEFLGTKINREQERVEAAPLPDIFTNISNEDYQKLIPLLSKSFISIEKRRAFLLHPEISQMKDFSWESYFDGSMKIYPLIRIPRTQACLRWASQYQEEKLADFPNKKVISYIEKEFVVEDSL